jgi:hypothetical protein
MPRAGGRGARRIESHRLHPPSTLDKWALGALVARDAGNRARNPQNAAGVGEQAAMIPEAIEQRPARPLTASRQRWASSVPRCGSPWSLHRWRVSRCCYPTCGKWRNWRRARPRWPSGSKAHTASSLRHAYVADSLSPLSQSTLLLKAVAVKSLKHRWAVGGNARARSISGVWAPRDLGFRPPRRDSQEEGYPPRWSGSRGRPS